MTVPALPPCATIWADRVGCRPGNGDSPSPGATSRTSVEMERLGDHVPRRHGITGVVGVPSEDGRQHLALTRQLGGLGPARTGALDHPRLAVVGMREDNAHLEEAHLGLATAGVV